MKSRLLSQNYTRYSIDDEFVYQLPGGYYTIDTCESPFGEYEQTDEVWLGGEFKTLEDYISHEYEDADCLFIKVFHRKYASVKLTLNNDMRRSGYEAIILHDDGMIQMYPRVFVGETGADVSSEWYEYFDTTDNVEYGDTPGCESYMIANGKLYNYSAK